ncbi:MAG: chalcone isomerase family protein [Bdellovibrionales bacterium]|nr:chalcone isomerase family protein [Bdellovibrionales bacterium]
MKIYLFSFFTAFSLLGGCGQSQKKIELAKPLPDQLTVNDIPLILNGSGVKIASKFGLSAKIYRAGLYLPEKNKEGAKVLEDPKPKTIFMRFVFQASRKDAEEGWERAYLHSCYLDCNETHKDLKAFFELLPEIKVGQVLTLHFLSDRLQIFLDNQKLGEVVSTNFSKNLLAIFIGSKVLDEKFKRQLLGQIQQAR